MNDVDIDLPKVKELVEEELIISDLDLTQTINIKPPVTINFFWCFGVFLFIFFSLLFLLFGDIKFSLTENYVTIEDVEVLAYDNADNTVQLAIVPSSNQEECSYITGDKEVINGVIKDNTCIVNANISEGEVVFTNKLDIKSKSLIVDDYVIDLNEKEKYYLPLNAEIELGVNKITVGKPDIDLVSVSESLHIVDNKVKGIKNGIATVAIVVNGEKEEEIDIVVTDTIVSMPKNFNEDKGYLPCEEYTLDESKLLDEILAYRINEAGYGTRAGAVAAARFLTLEFPYRIAYYWETGRLNNTGKDYVDGEGRYYHKGLYLHESKYADLEASALGPKIWGCKMKCYEDDPPYFYPGKKYPNGLDCSGFVTWVLYNAGFDVGDRGAGESPTPYQLTDLGEFRTVTTSLINSGKIKPGDLFNYWGHISILVGEDEDNYYIAESLNTLGGVVIKTYSKKKVMNIFKYVVLMDKVYKEDGNLTYLWY
jgi:hypothetical protein